MNNTDQLQLIDDTIKKTKERLQPLGYNFIFWGILIISMSFVHLLFPSFVQQTRYSAVLYWVIFPLGGIIYTLFYNIKIKEQIGYETHLSRVIKIIWGVFNLSWIIIVVVSFFEGFHPVPQIIFLLAITTLISGLIIKFTPVIVGGLSLFALYIGMYVIGDINYFIVNILALTFGLLLPGFALYYNKRDE